jgi:hypothetical protein
VLGWNVAVTVFADDMVTVQVPPFVVVHPVQLLNSDVASGTAASVIVAPFGSTYVHPVVELQAIPSPWTAPPAPVPAVFTVSAYVVGWNVAVTVFADAIVTVQVGPFAVVHPVQLFRIEVAPGVAVRVTVAPLAMAAVQPAVDPVVQAMPGPVTVPAPPDAAAFTVSMNVLGWNVAMTVFADVIVTVQIAPFVVVHPVQLLNSDVAFGTAVSVIVAPFGSTYVHPVVELQSIPSPWTTPPAPVPAVFTVSAYVLGMKVAVTVLAPVIETVQTFPNTVVQPLHPVRIDPSSGVAVSVTAVAGEVLGTETVHPAVEPVVQEMPSPVTVPRPVPDVFAVRSQVVGWNVAVAVLAPVIVTVQTFSNTEVQPLQLVNIESGWGAAVSVTVVAGDVRGTETVHPAVEPVVQLTPPPVTVPRPYPDVLTVRSATALNVAFTVFTASIVTVQTFPETVVHPLQPTNVEAASGVAVSVTTPGGDVLGYEAVHPAVHGWRQEIPSPVTVPMPEPHISTVSE